MVQVQLPLPLSLGPLVKRSRHRPFTAVTGVRFPHGSPDGSLAQLGEHLPYKQRVTGSSPVTSTKFKALTKVSAFSFCLRGNQLPFSARRGPVHARRVSALVLSKRQSFSRQPFCGATELRKQYAVAGLGISPLASGGNGPHARRAPKRADNLRFSTLLGSSPFPFVPKSAHGTALPFLFVLGTEKGERQYRYQLVGRKAPFLSQLRSSR